MLIVTSQIIVKFTLFVYNMSGSKVTQIYSPKNNWYYVIIHVCDEKNLSYGLWFDMIFIQLVCFLSPRQDSGIENTKLDG
jgi:hypothetical protein